MNKGKQIFLLSCCVLIGFLLRINGLGVRSLWTDEFFTFFQASGHGMDINSLLAGAWAQKTPGLLKAGDFQKFFKNDALKSIKDVNEGLLRTDTHPPFYFWIIYFWMRIFGDSVLAVRFFSLLLGLVSIYLAYKVGANLFDEDTAVFCALFASFSAFAVRYSQEARSYSLIMALSLLSWFLIQRYEKRGLSRDVFLFAIVNSLGIYTHYFYIFVAFAQFAYFSVIYRQESRLLTRFYLSLMFSLLLLSFWVIPVGLIGYNYHLTEWLYGFPGFINKVYYLLTGFIRYFLICDNSAAAGRVFLFTGVLLFLYLVFSSAKGAARKYPRQLAFCLAMCLVPVFAMFLMDFIQHGALLQQERFWMFSFAGFVLLAGVLLKQAFENNRLITILFILLMLVSGVSVSALRFGPAPRDISLWINQESKSRPCAVIIYNIRSAVLPQSYYLDKDINLVPVANEEQLKNAVSVLSNRAEKLFLARHYHSTDRSLMSEAFMEIRDLGSGFSFKQTVKKDGVSVSEYIK